MASTFVTVPATRPFLSVNKINAPSLSQLKLAGLKRNSLKINAISKKWEPTKVVPQADRVLIRLEDLPEKSSGGVLLPKSAVKFERYLMGEVLSVGAEAGEVEAGKEGHLILQVLFSDINAYEIDLGTDAKHCFCKAGDLLAVVE
ncbi:10 KDA HEAT SHOCK PROTEIN [Salix viminalis]|uniref:10 kDa HEAT SHOCK PROTEIN n=1 Tax=Salix viminalis TaxID=40686 RepID=A0A9Q0NTK9_SALVM|nr:10 KDA HEAT SHOCK PROTEIN [Salix viminalis]